MCYYLSNPAPAYSNIRVYKVPRAKATGIIDSDAIKLCNN